MTTGDQPAFPSGDTRSDTPLGMTYRQWLIGQIASDQALWALDGKDYVANEIVFRADAILARLDKERGER